MSSIIQQWPFKSFYLINIYCALNYQLVLYLQKKNVYIGQGSKKLLSTHVQTEDTRLHCCPKLHSETKALPSTPFLSISKLPILCTLHHTLPDQSYRRLKYMVMTDLSISTKKIPVLFTIFTELTFTGHFSRKNVSLFLNTTCSQVEAASAVFRMLETPRRTIEFYSGVTL